MENITKSPFAVGTISFVFATALYLSGISSAVFTGSKAAVLSATNLKTEDMVAQEASVSALKKRGWAQISAYQRLEFKLSTRLDKLSKQGANVARLNETLSAARGEIDAALEQLNGQVSALEKLQSAQQIRVRISTQTAALQAQFSRIDALFEKALTEVKILEKSLGN